MITELFLRFLRGLLSVKTLACLGGIIIGSFMMKHFEAYRDFYISLDLYAYRTLAWVMGF